MVSQLTPEMLADLGVPHDIRISPSGQYVIYTVRSDSSRSEGERWPSSIWIADVGKEGSARKLADDVDGWRPQWSTDSKSIVFVSGAALYLLSINGVDVTALTPTSNEALISMFCWSPDGRYIAYLSADEKSPELRAKEEQKDDPMVYGENWQFNRLRYIDVRSKQVTTLVSAPCHVCDFAWSPDSKMIAYGVQSTPEIQSAFQTGTLLDTVAIQDKKTSGPIPFPSALSDLSWVGSHLWWRATYDLSNTMSSNCVYNMSVERGVWIRRGYGEKNDANPSVWPPGMRSTRAGLIVQILAGLRDQLHILPSGQVIYDEMHQVKSWDATSHDNKLFIAVIKSSPSKPCEVFSVIDGSETCLSNHGADIAKLNIAEGTPLYATASDGTTIDALLYTPTDPKILKPYPTIAIAHGGPIFRFSFAFDPELQQWIPWLVSRGYAVLAPNYGGSYSRGDSFTARVRGRCGHEDYSDFITVVKAAVAEGIVDEKRCAVGGYSAGGYLSYVAVTRDSTFHFVAAVCGGGYVDGDLAAQTSDEPIYPIHRAGPAPWMSNDGGKDVWNREGSPIYHMENIKTPILILHAENDPACHVSHAKSFHRGCLYRGVKCELVIYPREGHGAFPPFERMHYIDSLNRIEKFYEKHLKGSL